MDLQCSNVPDELPTLGCRQVCRRHRRSENPVPQDSIDSEITVPVFESVPVQARCVRPTTAVGPMAAYASFLKNSRSDLMVFRADVRVFDGPLDTSSFRRHPAQAEPVAMSRHLPKFHPRELRDSTSRFASVKLRSP